MSAPNPTLPEGITAHDLFTRWTTDAATDQLDLATSPAAYRPARPVASSHIDDVDVVDEDLEQLLDRIWDADADAALDELFEMGALVGPAWKQVSAVVEETIAEGDLDAAAAVARALHRRHLGYRFSRAMLTRITALDEAYVAGDPTDWVHYADLLICYVSASYVSRHNGWWRNVHKVAGMARKGTPTLKLVAAAVAASHRVRYPTYEVDLITKALSDANERMGALADRDIDLAWIRDLVADLAVAGRVTEPADGDLAVVA